MASHMAFTCELTWYKACTYVHDTDLAEEDSYIIPEDDYWYNKPL